MMTAIILAAGRGHRLGKLTEREPKCFLTVGPQTLLEHQVEALASHGVRDVVVVVGYQGELATARLNGLVRVIFNPHHDSTNSLYSLWLAREHAREGFLLLNADVLFDPEILTRVLASPYLDALAVECRRSFTAEEMKVELDGRRILAMSKDLGPARSHAENLGVLKFSPQGARALFDRTEQLLAAGAEHEYCPYAFDAIAAERPLHAVPTDGLPWIEIDFAEDLRRARKEVWPAIQARRQRQAPLSASIAADNPSGLEGFGYPVAAAMACGKPAVCTNYSSLPELLDDGQGGFLCPPDDVEAFPEPIRELGGDPALRERMGACNRAKAEREFSQTHCLEQYIALYPELL